MSLFISVPLGEKKKKSPQSIELPFYTRELNFWHFFIHCSFWAHKSLYLWWATILLLIASESHWFSLSKVPCKMSQRLRTATNLLYALPSCSAGSGRKHPGLRARTQVIRSAQAWSPKAVKPCVHCGLFSKQRNVITQGPPCFVLDSIATRLLSLGFPSTTNNAL